MTRSNRLSCKLTVEPLESRRLLSATVVARHVFYNNSAWDGNDAAANAADDGAIATDKTALLPGQAATFANYTSYSKGLNGMMIDVQGLTGTPTLADFGFRAGNVNNTATWTVPGTAPSVSLRPGAGAAGSDRITLIWPDGAITKTWLEVTLRATAATGLALDNVFYFGNAIGESGNSATDAQVNAADELAARGNPRNIANQAPVTFPFDYNRDKQVNAADQLIARGNPANLATALRLIVPPALGVEMDASAPSVDTAGDVIMYTVTISNASAVPLSNVSLQLSPPLSPARQADLPGDNDNLLEAGEVWVYTSTYVATQADMDAGIGIIHVATGDSDQTGPAFDEVSVDVIQSPALSLTPTADGDGVDSAGEHVLYSYRAQNSGNVTLTGVIAAHSRGLVLTRGADSPGNNDDRLDVGETWTYASDYVVTQADIDAGADLTGSLTVHTDQIEASIADPRVVVGVTVIPIDHASFVMMWNGKVIYVDPVGGAAPYAGLPKADLILVTHNHSDHYSNSTLTAVAAPTARIIAPQNVFNSMPATLRNMTTVLTNNTSTDAIGAHVEAIPAYNANHPQGTGNGYVVTLGAKRIYISGDTGNIPEARALVNIDIAFVCMNVPFTMSVDDAAAMVRAFRPHVVYPYHYRNQDNTFADLNRFKTLVGTDLGIEVRLRNWY